MCLITNQTEPLIAKKDIKVYKLLDEGFTPYYHWGIKYELNKLFETTIKLSENPCFHGNNDAKWAKKFLEKEGFKYFGNVLTIIKSHPTLRFFGQGFHSAKLKVIKKSRSTSLSKRGIITECVIPKGSEYYTNPVGLYISNKIIINRVLDKKEYEND